MVELVDWLMAGQSGRYALVVVARPELSLLPKADLSVETLHLPALGDEVMDRLLATLAPGLAPQARVAVRRRADGVPLYAVELARMLQDRADLGAPAGELSPADLPASLRALISARIDELPPRPRATLLAASVLGQSFALDALADDRGQRRRRGREPARARRARVRDDRGACARLRPGAGPRGRPAHGRPSRTTQPGHRRCRLLRAKRAGCGGISRRAPVVGPPGHAWRSRRPGAGGARSGHPGRSGRRAPCAARRRGRRSTSSSAR